MKITATTTSARIAFSAPGIGWRARRLRTGFGGSGLVGAVSLGAVGVGSAARGWGFGAAVSLGATSGFASSAAAGSPFTGTSALIGRLALTAEKATWGSWLAVQLKFHGTG